MKMRRWQMVCAVMLASTASLMAGLDAPVVETPEVLQRAAMFGDATAQFKLAMAYLEGSSALPKDPAKAAEWFRKAATAGLAAAQYNLGVLLSNGKDMPRNDKEAALWFSAAAKNGNFEAQVMMVRFLGTGRGVEKNAALALWWDMIARRTLELKTAISAGGPPKPGALRADGAAEMTDKDGRKVWMLPDGTKETQDETGVRHLEHKDGAKSTVQRDGSWETVFPNGLREQVSVEGRRTLTDGKGNVEIYETDGSHVVEGDGRTDNGRKVRVRDTFGVDGKRLSHRVKSGDSSYEERADGTKIVETEVTSEEGVPMIITEQVGEDGQQSKGKLRRADNSVGPKGSEIWVVRRKLHLQGGIIANVVEKYSEFGLYAQEMVSQTREITGMPGVIVSTPRFMGTPPPMQAVTVTRTLPNSMPIPGGGFGGRSLSGYEDPKAFAPAPDIAPMLATLAKAELEARNFAGATEADYQRAKTGSAGYFIPLAVTPQSATAAPAWLREKTISQVTLHEEQLIPIVDDRSSKVPLGAYGSDVIKQLPWKHAETQHFIIHYVGDAEARLTVQYIEGVFTVLTQLLNLDTARGATKSHVFIFPEGAWKDFTAKKGLPPQVEGFAFKTELLLGASAARGDRWEAIKVICHEVTHALVARFYPGVRPPLWLNEGMAEYIATRTMRTKAVSATPPRTFAKPDAQIDVAQLFARLHYGEATSPDRIGAFYANSQKAVQVLFEKLPLDGFPRFFNLIVAGNEPGISLSSAYGKQCDGVAAFRTILNAQ